jgi:hypothetical protein
MTRLGLVICVVLFSSNALAAEKLLLTPCVRARAQSIDLIFHLQNHTSSPVTIDAARLPWGWRYALTVAARDVRTKADLPQEYGIDDTVRDPLTLAPGQVITGTLALDDRLPGLAGKVRKGSVEVVWSYALTVAPGEVQRWEGRFTIGPRSRISNPSGASRICSCDH